MGAIAKRIARLLEVQTRLSPPLISGLNPPADKEDISRAEQELGIEFPSDLCELLLCANGQPYMTEGVSPIFPGHRFAETGWQGRASYGWLLSLDEIVERVKWFREQYDEFGESSDEPFELIGPVVFHRQFIEFTASENSDNLVVDLQPSHGGTVGQVVMMRTQPCQLAVLAPSLSEFLDLIIDGFQQGRYLPNCHGEIPVWWDGGWDD